MKLRSISYVIMMLALDAAAQSKPLGCLVEPNEVVEVGSPVVGLLERVHVDRGDVVKEGQVLAQLQADVERAAVTVAQTRAQKQAEMQSAASAYDFAQRKRARTESLFQANFISSQVRDEARTEAELAALRLKQAQEQRQQSSQELSFARTQLAQRTIKSPISGVVVERYMARGERAEEKPILRLAALDPLKVEVIMPASEFNTVRIGMPAAVTLDLPKLGERQAKVTHVDRVMDAASNTFRVRLALPNPNHALPAGVHCKVAIGGDGAAKSSAATPPARTSSTSAGAKAAAVPASFKMSRSLQGAKLPSAARRIAVATKAD
jgi:membrane fusion protein, heavy metal efflux system